MNLNPGKAASKINNRIKMTRKRKKELSPEKEKRKIIRELEINMMLSERFKST